MAESDKELIKELRKKVVKVEYSEQDEDMIKRAYTDYTAPGNQINTESRIYVTRLNEKITQRRLALEIANTLKLINSNEKLSKSNARLTLWIIILTALLVVTGIFQGLVQLNK